VLKLRLRKIIAKIGWATCELRHQASVEYPKKTGEWVNTQRTK
jgi:hypothetical protein